MDAQQQTEMANAIRFLSADAVEKAKSGHPGAPMGMAEIAQVLWHKHLRHNPKNPNWANRDRFVLSNGHGSMLLYSLLYLSGYQLSIEDIKNFRQLHSKTPGHPECDITPGVETTSGPLGQGLANAVGMALAEKMLADEFNKDNHNIVDHHTYAFIGDGCLMEGVSHEACSLAGTLRLSKLIVIYDDNDISIDGFVKGWFTDDTPARFRAYGWNVIHQVDGHDFSAIDEAIASARKQSTLADGKPTLICCKTIIGKGAPNKQGTQHVHGAPLGSEELQASRDALGWTHPPFVIPQDILSAWNAGEQGDKNESEWLQQLQQYTQQHPELAKEFKRRANGSLPENFSQLVAQAYESIATQAKEQGSVATRKASQQALDALAPLLPEFFGGSADLTGSNLTNFKDITHVTADHGGNYLSYGVREFGMAAMMNGVALHKGYIPYGGTFLTFSDYSRNAIRMSALMKQRVIHVFTHDSIGLGEDGPTHQSIEHIPSLRIIPELDVWRPCDALESAVAWVSAIARQEGSSALIFSRQAVNNIHTDVSKVSDIEKGAYRVNESVDAQAVIVATGTEVGIALEAQQELNKSGISVNVVSMPCSNAFDRQPQSYQQQVLPENLPIIAIEAASPDFWHKYTSRSSRRGAVIGIESFGLSAPAKELYSYFGITVENLCQKVKQCLSNQA